jgi:hypothetical protein
MKFYCPNGHLHEAMIYEGEQIEGEAALADLVEKLKAEGTLEFNCRECGAPVTGDGWHSIDNVLEEYDSVDAVLKDIDKLENKY